VLDLLADSGLALGDQETSDPPSLPTIGEAAQRAYQRADLIAADPDYGRIICHCERVTHGEVRDALTAVVPARTLEGLRRRTRVQMGRFQGFYCGAEVRSVLENVLREVGA